MKEENISTTLSKSEYKSLSRLYCRETGNFQMSREFVLNNIDLIESFIKIHNNYFLVYQHLDEYDGNDWFLTDFIE